MTKIVDRRFSATLSTRDLAPLDTPLVLGVALLSLADKAVPILY